MFVEADHRVAANDHWSKDDLAEQLPALFADWAVLIMLPSGQAGEWSIFKTGLTAFR